MSGTQSWDCWELLRTKCHYERDTNRLSSLLLWGRAHNDIVTQWAKETISALISEYSHTVARKALLVINYPASGILSEQPQRPRVPAKWRQQENFIHPQEALRDWQKSAWSFPCTEPQLNADHTVHMSHFARVVLRTLFRDGEQTHVEGKGSVRQPTSFYLPLRKHEFCPSSSGTSRCPH